MRTMPQAQEDLKPLEAKGRFMARRLTVAIIMATVRLALERLGLVAAALHTVGVAAVGGVEAGVSTVQEVEAATLFLTVLSCKTFRVTAVARATVG